MTYFTEEQVKLLLACIHPNRVRYRDGMSHVEGYDIRAELTRIFGFGRWNSEILDQALLCERETKTKTYTDKKTGQQKGGHPAWYVVYRSRVRLTVSAPDGTVVAFHDGSHVGASTHPDFGEAHGNALTNSETYALRRAAINLGDQFGLSLYNKGSLEPIVRWTLVRPEPAAEKVDTDDVLQVSAEDAASSPDGSDEPQNGGEASDQAKPSGHTENTTDAAAAPPGDSQREQPWLDWALAQAVGLKDEKAAGNLWQETVSKAHKGEITDEDKQHIRNVIGASVDDLRKQAMEQALMALPEGDDWREKIRGLASDDEARESLAEVSRLTADREMAPPRAGRIAKAITARFPKAARSAEPEAA